MHETPLLSMTGVSLGYRAAGARSEGAQGAREVLTDVTFDLARGELLAVVGPNGAGKTTLLRAMAGTHAPCAGTIMLEGRPLGSIPRVEIARLVAVVPQELPSAEGFTVREVVAMGRAPHQGRWLRPSSRDDAIVDEQLALLGLEALEARPFDALSGGERRRAMVAQALAQSPKLLLLDEPAAFLDVRHALELFTLLAKEIARGLSVVASIHDATLVMRYAARVALLADGAIEALGTTDEVMTPALLGRVFGVELRALLDAASGARALVPVRPL